MVGAGAISSVWPSGADFCSKVAAMIEPAPALFSTMKSCRAAAQACRRSAAPSGRRRRPAQNGTTSVTGRDRIVLRGGEVREPERTKEKRAETRAKRKHSSPSPSRLSPWLTGSLRYLGLGDNEAVQTQRSACRWAQAAHP